MLISPIMSREVLAAIAAGVIACAPRRPKIGRAIRARTFAREGGE
jgi:hypothetical protein